MEEKTGLSGLEKNAKGREQEKITFDDMVRQPRFIISSVTSTGKNDKNRRYSPFTTSTEDKVPFRTVTGRQSFYCDHEMMRDYGEAMALYKPVLSYAPVKGDYAQEGVPQITLKYLTPHHKWSTHSMYFDRPTIVNIVPRWTKQFG